MGFFSVYELEKKGKSLGDVSTNMVGCPSCGLYRNVLSPKMKPFGKGKKDILVIGEAPGEEEDKRGKPWQGKAGNLLRLYLRKYAGIDLFNDCVSINAVSCRPPENRTPTPEEIRICHSRVVSVIRSMKPKMIILVGGAAMSTFLFGRWKKGGTGINTWRGWQIPDIDFNCWACPIFHPSYVHRSKTHPEIEMIFRRDIKNLKRIEKKDWPDPVTDKNIDILYHEEDIVSFLNRIKGQDIPISFDYETTGRKPHTQGHRIVCVAIAPNRDKAVAFPNIPSKRVQNVLKRILASKITPKIAFNMKFEDAWTHEILKVPVHNWLWDPMLAAHIIDNRVGISGLKFQTYVHFGVSDYDSDISPFLKGTNEKDANSFNRIHELEKSKTGMHNLLKYGAMDSIFTYRLALLQMEEFSYDLPDIP